MQNVYHDNDLNVYIQVDAVKSISEYDQDNWVFEGIASTQDMDLYNEVVYPESFINSIEFFKNNGKIFFDHDYAKNNTDWLVNLGFTKDEIISIRTPIGKPLDAKITDEGLYIRAVLNKEHPMARLMWNQYLNNSDETFRDQLGLSIGAKYLGQPRKEYDSKKGKYVTYLPDLLLYEVSLTPEPVNPHTKSWKAALKSIMDKKDLMDVKTQYHHIQPESIEFDSENSKIVVKSLVEDADGVIHVFEQIIDIKEDVIKSMEKEMKAMENVVKNVAAKTATMPMTNAMAKSTPQVAPVVKPKMAMKAEEEEQAAPPPAPEMPEAEAPPAPTGMDAAPPPPTEDVAAAGPAPAMEGGAVPDAAAPEEPAMEGGSSSVLEELAAQSDAGGDMGQGAAGGESDESSALMLDKLDALTDIVSQLLEKMEAMTGGAEQGPAEEQTTTEVPQLKSVIRDTVTETLKSTQAPQLEISEQSAQMLADTIKSVLVSMEASIFDKVTERIISDGILVTQKSVNKNRSEVKVVHPGAATDGTTDNNVDSQVMKSVANASENSDLTGEQMDSLKSFVSEYNSIRGYTTDKAQQRATIIERASKELNIHPTIFNVYANKAQKGRF